MDNPLLFSKINVDLLTWRSLINRALRELNGIIGEARHFDILLKSDDGGLRSVIRIQSEDAITFAESLEHSTFGLDEYLGQDYPFSARVMVNRSLANLGLLVEQNMIQIESA